MRHAASIQISIIVVIAIWLLLAEGMFAALHAAAGDEKRIITGTVQIGVFLATQARQRELDSQYGPGLVILVGALEPID